MITTKHTKQQRLPGGNLGGAVERLWRVVIQDKPSESSPEEQARVQATTYCHVTAEGGR